MMKTISVCVSNDLTFDQRVKKTCDTLQSMGFEIKLVGRKLPDSKPIDRPYKTHRFGMLFKSGALFYAAFNFRLFFHLLFSNQDIILCNDLDTLPTGFLVAKLKGKEIVYDSHEYFTEAEGLTGRPFPKKVWKTLEKWIFPKLRHVYTVNESIAKIYRDEYDAPVKVVRNMPPKRTEQISSTRKELGLPEDKKIVLLQGAFIDPDRGAKEMALAMEHLEGVLFLIIGSGTEKETVRQIREEKGLQDKIMLLDKQPFEVLQKYTSVVDLGISLDKPVHLNYKFSLPNKLFDYIQAGVPVLTSRLKELVRVHNQYDIGMMIDSHDPQEIALKVKECFSNEARYKQWKQNLQRAANEFNWENESKRLERIFKSFL
ncbi:glycosyltransferase [Halocola ammonii]